MMQVESSYVVIAEMILIKIVTVVSLQEWTFASGGKNKAVKKKNHPRKIESFGSYLLEGEGGNLHPRPWGAWQETKPCGRGAAAPLWGLVHHLHLRLWPWWLRKVDFRWTQASFSSHLLLMFTFMRLSTVWQVPCQVASSHFRRKQTRIRNEAIFVAGQLELRTRRTRTWSSFPLLASSPSLSLTLTNAFVIVCHWWDLISQ